MNLIRWLPRKEADVFPDLWQLDSWLNFPVIAGAGEGFTAPKFSLKENQGQIILKAGWPQVEGRKVKVQVKNHLLTVRGETKQSSETKEKGYYFSQSHYGSFERNFPIPETVNTRKVKSSYKGGILEIVLPKKAAK